MRARAVSITLTVGIVLTAAASWHLFRRQEPSSGKSHNASLRSRGAHNPRPVAQVSQGDSVPTKPTGRATPDAAMNEADLPVALRDRLDDASYKPRERDVPLLTPSAEKILIEQYQRIPSITNKVHLACILALGGSDATVRALSHALTNEYDGRMLAKSEHMAMLGLPVLLGRTAARCDSALEFLTDASSLEFWRVHCRWRFEQDRTVALGILAGSAAMGIGMSGRPEAIAILRTIRDQEVPSWPPEARGLIVDAAFRHAMVRQYGPDVFSSGQDTLPLFFRWRATPEAEEWSR